jgi:hypothetical protein
MVEVPLPTMPAFDGEEILAGIRRWVEIETPSHDGEAVNRLVDLVESDLMRFGARTIRTLGRDGYGDILECPSSERIGQAVHFRKGVSAPSVVKVTPRAVDAASGDG